MVDTAAPLLDVGRGAALARLRSVSSEHSYLFAAEVFTRPGEPPGWPSYRARLEQSGYELLDGYYSSTTRGAGGLAQISDGLFWWFDADAPELAQLELPAWPAERCPYIGDASGVFCWQPFQGFEPQLLDHLFASRGRLHRWLAPDSALVQGQLQLEAGQLSAHRSALAVARVELPLSNLLSKWGFDDAAMLLERDPDTRYWRELSALLDARCASLGLVGTFHCHWSSHNPLRLVANLPRHPDEPITDATLDGSPITGNQLWDRLADEYVSFWFYDTYEGQDLGRCPPYDRLLEDLVLGSD